MREAGAIAKEEQLESWRSLRHVTEYFGITWTVESSCLWTRKRAFRVEPPRQKSLAADLDGASDAGHGCESLTSTRSSFWPSSSSTIGAVEA